MGKQMKITITITDENGETLVEQQSERTIPYIDEIDRQGFRAAFHDLETAVLESRQEVSNGAMSEYLEHMSKKNGKYRSPNGTPRRKDV